jgi:hypothetical protein
MLANNRAQFWLVFVHKMKIFLSEKCQKAQNKIYLKDNILESQTMGFW